MKFLQAAALSAICVGYVIASDPDYVGYDGLQRAIDEGRLDIAVELCEQDWALGEEGVEYVIGKDDPDLIANFVNQTNQANTITLDKLWLGSPIETVEKVLEKVTFPQQALVDLASYYHVVCHPKQFLVFLNKMVTPEDQEKAVEKAIEQLVHDQWSTVAPLLHALKGKIFRSERLEHLATQKAFMAGVKSGRVALVTTDICEHAAITPELYADALTATAARGKYNEMRLFLIKQAELYDLETVKEKEGYEGLNPEFRNEIEEALREVAHGGTRTRAYDIQSAKIAKKEFIKIEHAVAIPGIANIIAEYLTFQEVE